MSRLEIATIVETAHERGAKVRAHVAEREMLLECVELGVDVVDHGDEIDDEIIERMVEAGTFWVPSLVYVWSLLELGMGSGSAPAPRSTSTSARCSRGRRRQASGSSWGTTTAACSATSSPTIRSTTRSATTAVSSASTPTSRASRRPRSEEHTSELQSLMRISYAVFCLKQIT